MAADRNPYQPTDHGSGSAGSMWTPLRKILLVFMVLTASGKDETGRHHSAVPLGILLCLQSVDGFRREMLSILQDEDTGE